LICPIVFSLSRGRWLIEGIENKTELLLKEVLAWQKECSAKVSEGI
jgi:hypothetical protein